MAIVIAILQPAIGGTPWLAVAWIAGVFAALATTSRVWGRRCDLRGVGSPPRVWAIAVALCLGCLVASAVASAALSASVADSLPFLLVLAGYAALGAIQRDPWTTVAVLPGVAAGVGLSVSGAPGWGVDLGFGVGLVAAGLTLRASERRAA